MAAEVLEQRHCVAGLSNRGRVVLCGSEWRESGDGREDERETSVRADTTPPIGDSWGA
jgi:hypothetical protein